MPPTKNSSRKGKKPKYNLVLTHYDFDGRMLSYEVIYNIAYSPKQVSITTGSFTSPITSTPVNQIYQVGDGYKSLIWIDRESRNFTSDHS